jgi:hypothetical protein
LIIFILIKSLFLFPVKKNFLPKHLLDCMRACEHEIHNISGPDEPNPGGAHIIRVSGNFFGVTPYRPSIISDNEEVPVLWFPDIFVIFVSTPSGPKPKSFIVRFFWKKLLQVFQAGILA